MPREFILAKRAIDTASVQQSNNNVAKQPKTVEQKPDDYLTKLARLVPVEVIGAFIAGVNLITAAAKEEYRDNWQWYWYIIISLAAIPYLIWGAKLKKIWSFALIYIAFHLWVVCFGGPFEGIELQGMSIKVIGALVSLAYTLAIPKWVIPKYED